MRRADTAGLLDRDRELASVRRLLDGAVDGLGGLLLIDGEAGIGKTGLVRAACRTARDRGLQVLAARGGELERDLAFGVTRELLAPATLAAERAGCTELFVGAAALAEPVLAPVPAAPADGNADVFGVLHGLYWLTAGFTTATPALIAVDDAHWCDLPSLRFLAYLAHRIEGLNVALLVAARPPEHAAPQQEMLDLLAAQPPAVVIRPRPLGQTAVRSLASDALGEAADAAFGEACRAATGGNPFLLGELLAELRATGVPPLVTQIDRLASVAPGGVRRAVLTRLARLPDGAAALARAVAVLGDGSTTRVAAQLAGIPGDRVADLVDALVSARILEPHLALTFVHPLVRTAVSTASGPGELAAAHHQAARLLVADGGHGDVVFAHLLAADPRADPWVVGLLREAAVRAAARGAPEISARYLRRALAEPPLAEDRSCLLLELGVAEMHAGLAEALGHLADAADQADGPVDRARASLMLARTLFLAGRIVEAVAVCERALEELAGRAPELALELEVELVTAATQDVTTRPVAVRRHAGRVGIPQPTSRAAAMMLANMAIEEVIVAGSRQRAVELAELALRDGWLYDDHAVVTLPSAVLSLTLSGHARRAMSVWDEVIARYPVRGDVRGFALASAFRGYAAYYVGDLDAAVADTRSALELSRGAALMQLTEGFATAWLVYALIETGDHASADKELTEKAAMLGHGAPFTANYLLSARGQLRLAQGRFDDAVADLQECGRRTAAWRSDGPALCRWRAHLALALLGRGDRAEAAVVADEAVRLATAWGVPFLVAEAQRAAGLSADGHSGLALLQAAVAAAEAAESPLERARAQAALGGALRRAGRRVEARGPLRSAVDLALGCGASTVALAAHDELVAAGARPRRLRLTGSDALTATERRVATMAASDMTNRAVAQALFVSEKTVETHLGQVYRKLGITARSQLVQALSPATEDA